MYMLPALSNVSPAGKLRLADVAGPPSPAKPDVPIPAMLLIVNFGAWPKHAPIGKMLKNTLANTRKPRLDTVIS